MADDAIVVAARAIGVDLSAEAGDRIARFLRAMLEENQRVNLTAVRDPAQAVALHAVDSVALALAIDEPPRAIFDLGTGNGFPGAALAALWPEARVVLCDRTRKKLDAIARCLVVAEIRAETLWADADQLAAREPTHRRAYDLVVARAVGEPAAIARAAAPLLESGGRLALWLTADDRPPVTLAGAMHRERIERYDLPEPAPRARVITIWRKG